MDTSSPASEVVPSSEAVPSVKRERRSLEIKRQIVEETLVPGASVARVARAHGVNANQVFYWRHLYRVGRLGEPRATATRLLPVRLSPADARESMVPTLPALEIGPSGREGGRRPGTIEVELRKARLHIVGQVDPKVLRLVLQALLG